MWQLFSDCSRISRVWWKVSPMGPCSPCPVCIHWQITPIKLMDGVKSKIHRWSLTPSWSKWIQHLCLRSKRARVLCGHSWVLEGTQNTYRVLQEPRTLNDLRRGELHSLTRAVHLTFIFLTISYLKNCIMHCLTRAIYLTFIYFFNRFIS